MTKPIRVGVQLWPGGAPGYRSWRQEERQRLTAVAEDDVDVRVAVEEATENQPHRVQGGFGPKTPGRAEQSP